MRVCILDLFRKCFSGQEVQVFDISVSSLFCIVFLFLTSSVNESQECCCIKKNEKNRFHHNRWWWRLQHLFWKSISNNLTFLSFISDILYFAFEIISRNYVNSSNAKIMKLKIALFIIFKVYPQAVFNIVKECVPSFDAKSKLTWKLTRRSQRQWLVSELLNRFELGSVVYLLHVLLTDL